MKNFLIFVGSLLVFSFYFACTPEDYPDVTIDSDAQKLTTPIAPSALPAPITNYITTNYPNDTINEAFEHVDTSGNVKYDVCLSNGLDLYFAQDGTLLALGHDDDDDSGGGCDSITIGELPTPAIEYVIANYPNDTIIDIDLELTSAGALEYEVKLQDCTELLFNDIGTFLSQSVSGGCLNGNGGGSNDDDDDGDGDDDDGIPDNDDDD